MPAPAQARCAMCGSVQSATLKSLAGEYRRCGQCKLVQYCSVECQRRHWKKSHREECTSPEKEAAKKKRAAVSDESRALTIKLLKPCHRPVELKDITGNKPCLAFPERLPSGHPCPVFALAENGDRNNTTCRASCPETRTKFESIVVECLKRAFWRRQQFQVYASVGSGFLGFDWWILEKLRQEGWRPAKVILIDPNYAAEGLACPNIQTALRQFVEWFCDYDVQIFASLEQYADAIECGIDGALQCDVIVEVDVGYNMNPQSSEDWDATLRRVVRFEGLRLALVDVGFDENGLSRAKEPKEPETEKPYDFGVTIDRRKFEYDAGMASVDWREEKLFIEKTEDSMLDYWNILQMDMPGDLQVLRGDYIIRVNNCEGQAMSEPLEEADLLELRIERKPAILRGIECNNGHDLEEHPVFYNICDLCRMKGTRFRCSHEGCDYDLCQVCYGPQRERAKKKEDANKPQKVPEIGVWQRTLGGGGELVPAGLQAGKHSIEASVQGDKEVLALAAEFEAMFKV